MRVADRDGAVKTLPWKKPASVYESDGPTHRMAFNIHGAFIQVDPLDERGINSGRMRYRVDCLTCKRVLHEATTGPSSWIRGHLHDEHDLIEELKHAES